MQITLFPKIRHTADGKKFTTFLSTLTTKSGEEMRVSVKFRQSTNPPKDETPLNILIEKSDCSLSASKYTREDTGEVCTVHTLWLSNWTRSEDKFVDTSMDEIAGFDD